MLINDLVICLLRFVVEVTTQAPHWACLVKDAIVTIKAKRRPTLDK